MSRHKRKRKKPSGRPAVQAPSPEAILADLDAKLTEIEALDDAGPLWGDAHKLLLKSGVDAGEVAQVIMRRDPAELRRLLGRLRGEPVETPAPVEPEPETPGDDIPAEELKAAMRAFKKRMKLTKLDHESKLGASPLTGGKSADFDGILAPREFSAEVWQTLVARGELISMGSGFYKLPGD